MMKKALPSTVRKGVGLLALAVIFVVASNVAFSRQQERPKAKAWLGVSIRDVSEDIAKENKLTDETGAYVTEVSDRSPADSAGIEERDIIVELDQKKIDDADDLVKAVGKLSAGEKVNIVFVRKGEKKSVQVKLAKYPRRRGPQVAVENLVRRMRVFSDRGAQGMQLMELNDQLGEYFGVPSGTGVLVEKVRKESAAAKAGIKAGDVLLKIGKRTIDDMEDVSKAFSKFDEGDKVEVEVSRKGSSKTVSLEVQEDRDNSSFEIFRHGDGEMFQRPPFEENHFRTPHWNDQNYKFEFRDFHPDMEILEQNLHNMEKSLKNGQKNLLKSVKEFRMRSI